MIGEKLNFMPFNFESAVQHYSTMVEKENNVIAYMKLVEGWLFENEARLLYNLARMASKDSLIVEIGSWKGKSTVCLGYGSQHGHKARVWAVDPHTGSKEHKEMAQDGKVWTFEDFKRNMEMHKLLDVVMPRLQTSQEAFEDYQRLEQKPPIELVFIDGSHENKDVVLDFTLWDSVLAERGTIVFHDANWTSVWEAIKTIVLPSGRYNVHGYLDCSLIVNKIKTEGVV